MMLRRRTKPVPDRNIPAVPDGVLQVCHPDWRGIRASAEAFRDPVAMAADLEELVDPMRVASVTPDVIVIQGWPPGAEAFATAMHAMGIRVQAVFHSAPSQHGVDAGEAEAVADILALDSDGIITAAGTVKAGLAEAFSTIGRNIVHVPNRVPAIPDVVEEPALPEGPKVGIFLAPFWRKNVTTQVLAGIRAGLTPYVMSRPAVPYLRDVEMIEVGELGHVELLGYQSAMDIAFNVTLSECHPMMPMEAYRLGVPCLISRTSDLFRGFPELHRMTTVADADDPTAIATAANDLLNHRSEAVEQAAAALDTIDEDSRQRWLAFTGR